MKKILARIGLGILTVGILGACGKKEKQEEERIATDGSTSMEKVIGILGEAFMEENNGVNFTYNPTGSGSGIAAVVDDRTDIGLASRALKEEERAKGLVETPLAFDGIAIVVNKNNEVKNLSVEEVAAIYRGEMKSWSEVGGADMEIVVIGREAGSGTREGFESITKIKDKADYRQELTSTGDVITTVASNPGAVGYASIASVKENVKILSINHILPSEQTVKDGSYKIQRPFMLITKKEKELKGAVKRFFEFITSEKANSFIKKAGVVPVK